MSGGRVGALLVVAATTVACGPDGPSPAAATIGVVVEGCEPGLEFGSGMIVEPGLALVAAHVVAGARTIRVRHGDAEHTGTIVGFDPDMDLAYLSIPTIAATAIPIGPDGAAEGDTGTAWVVRDAEVIGLPVTVRRRVQLRTEDIYVEGETIRPSLELDAEIELGDSGGAVVVDGRVVGVLSLRSNRVDRRAYAIDPLRAGELIEQQRTEGDLGSDVDVSRC